MLDITVVVPYHNEMATIEYTLEQIGAQSLPAIVAIFVNSSSSDDTSDMVTRWIALNQYRFVTQFKNVYEESDTPASSKNVGIRRATTEWIAFMDCGQRLDTSWLERQARFVIATGLDVVSGVVQLAGENWVDRCAVAQTYGYKRNRACLPTTLVRRSVFDKTGLLLEGRRAIYDAVWVRALPHFGIERGINPAVSIRYIGTNFAASLPSLLAKSILYAKPAVGIEGYWTPYLYVTVPLAALVLAILAPRLLLKFVAAYIMARAFALPVLKSRGIRLYSEHPIEAILGLAVVGLVIDVGKMIGVMKGIDHYFVSRRGRATG